MKPSYTLDRKGVLVSEAEINEIGAKRVESLAKFHDGKSGSRRMKKASHTARSNKKSFMNLKNNFLSAFTFGMFLIWPLTEINASNLWNFSGTENFRHSLGSSTTDKKVTEPPDSSIFPDSPNIPQPQESDEPPVITPPITDPEMVVPPPPETDPEMVIDPESHEHHEQQEEKTIQEENGPKMPPKRR